MITIERPAQECFPLILPPKSTVMKKIVLFPFILTAISLGTYGQTGQVTGTVFKIEDEKRVPLAFAKVIELEEGKFAQTDFDGAFELSLRSGKHRILVRFTGMRQDTIGFTVVEGKNTALDIQMAENGELPVIYIDGRRSAGGTEVKAAKETRESEKVVAVQTGTQMAEKGAGDVGAATKKITGLSTIGSVLYVRGMGDRYNVVYLNGLPLPSPHPDFRVVPLDLFPTDVVDAVQVSKVMAAELYGDFAGGAFNIATKRFYDEPTFKVSLGTGGNTQTVGRSFKTYKGGATDFFGFDDGTRAIPQAVIDNSKELTNFPPVNDIFPNKRYTTDPTRVLGFENNFNLIEKTAQPNTNMSISGGTFLPFSRKDKSRGLGILALLKNKNALRYQEGVVKIINAQNEERLNYDVFRHNYTTSTTALLNLHLRLRPEHTISINSFAVNTSDDETRETWGYHFDYDPFEVYSRRMTYRQNHLVVNQVIGSHRFMEHPEDADFSRLKIEWKGAVNYTGSKEPDRRQLVALYTVDREETGDYDKWNALDLNDNHRFFSVLKEREFAAKAHVEYVLRLKEEKSEGRGVKATDLVTLRGGVDYRDKQREFDFKQYNYNIQKLSAQEQPIDIYNTQNYFSNENHQSGLFFVDEDANPASSYVADQSVVGTYLDVKLRHKRLEVIPGIRLESGSQKVLNRNQTTPSKFNNTIVPNDIADGLLPSLLLKYTASDKNVLRFAASKTLTRPKFNEVAPFQYIQFFAGLKTQGNDSLRNGTNYNFDFRYEHYPKPGEMITAGVFYKLLQTPIEQTMLATASGQLASFANAERGQAAGAEVEYVRSLDFLIRKSKRDSSFLKHFALGFNAAYMWTQVTVDANGGGNANTNSRRPLEGASPLLLNVDIRFKRTLKQENSLKKDLLVALAYNTFGRRLTSIGVNGIGDQYALPVQTLNLVTKLTWNDRLSIGLNGNNLLNPFVVIVQENGQSGGKDLNVSRFRRGIDISCSLSYTFVRNKTKK